VSAQHTAAVCFLYGEAGIAQYTDACACDPGVQAFGEKVAVEEDSAIPVEAAAVEVRTADGRTLGHAVAHARGSLARPMTDGEIETKVRELARTGAPGVDVDRLIAAVWDAEALDDAGALARLAAPRA